MSDATGHKNRPGAGPFSTDMLIDGIPLNVYINHNTQTGRVEIARKMPPGEQDAVVKEFGDDASAWEWVKQEFSAGRLPLHPIVR